MKTIKQMMTEILKRDINYEIRIGPWPMGHYMNYYATLVKWTRYEVEVKNLQTGETKLDGEHVIIAEIVNQPSIEKALIALLNKIGDTK